ncbi:MAG: NAD(P)H-hydrate dehydratase [Actinobacteria bacterium]|nr:NAD(P)H-hydrate dehydratase [Actinomycetota bacterium]
MTADAPTSLPLLSAAQAAAGDEAAVEAGATWAGLMDRAAGHLARGIVDLAGHGYGLRVAVLVGKGNNGGDGWAVARRLRAFGAQAEVVAVHGTDVDMSDEAEDNRRRWIDAGGRVVGLDGLEATLGRCDVAVDCLLGTGATGAPREPLDEVVAAINAARDRGVGVVACDLPTGVNGDDGRVPGDAVRADLTVTFGGLKRGLLLHPGAVHAGRIVLGDLGPGYDAERGDWRALTAAGAAPPPLPAEADKRARGTVLVVAGSVGMAGAAILCARGALAAGAGLVTVAVPQPIQDVVAQAVPPAMTIGLPADDDGTVAPAAAEEVADRAVDADVVVTGPGMRPTRGTRATVDAILAADCCAVLDADALNVFRGEGGDLADHRGALVLTPQHRELARITDLAEDGEEALTERSWIAPDLAAKLDAVVVAKGPGTVVVAPDGRVWVTPTGGPALGAGGSGDVLGGVIAATLATADDPSLAVARACWLSSLAGDLAGSWAADRSSSADLADTVPTALEVTQRLATARPSWPFDPPGWHVGRTPDDDGIVTAATGAGP